MSFDQEYYIVSSSFLDDQKMFEFDDKYMPSNLDPMIILREEPIHESVTFPLKLRAMEESYKLFDYHEMTKPVVHSRIKEILESHNLCKLNLVKTKIRLPNNDMNEEYFLIHTYNFIACVDKESSVYDALPSGRLCIEELALDEKKLSKIPEEERLIFRLDESTSIYLFHESIVNKIKNINPTGIKFYRVDDWDDGVAFR